MQPGTTKRAAQILAVAIGVAACAGVARADDAAPILRIDLHGAARRGAERSPDVAVARAPLASLEEARRAADQLFPGPPRVSLAGGARHATSGTGPELSVTVLQDVPLAGIAGARRRVAEGLAEVARLDTRAAEHDGALRAALAWVALAEAERVFALREEGRAQAEGLLALASARVRSGVAEPLESALARSELATSVAATLDAEGMIFDASADLRFAIGLPPAAPITAAGDVEALRDQAVDEAAVLARIERAHPRLQGFVARRATAADEARLARALQAPMIGVGASYVREGTGDQVWMGIVTLPLPLFHPGAFDAARLQAVASTHEAELGRARAELAREVHVVVHEREHARELFQALGGVLEPSREALRLATAQLAAGTLDLGRVLAARARVLTVAEQRTHAAAGAYRADLRLDALQGTLVPKRER